MADVTTPIRHAWATVREAAESGSREVDDEQLDSIEPGVRLLELSAAYRAAFEEHTSAQAEAMIAINKHRGRPAEHKEMHEVHRLS